MNKKYSFFFAAGAVLIFSAFNVVQKNGIQWWSGSPWDGGTGPAGTCANCHGGGATVPTFSVTANPAFGVGNTYIPGQSYTITATVNGNYPKYGFNIEIINSQSTSTASDMGTFGGGVSSNCTIFTGGANPSTASHNTPSGTGGTASFDFKWTAPASGTAYLYGCGLGVNNDGNDGSSNGDRVTAVTSMTLTASPAGIATAEAPGNVNLHVYPNPANDNIRVAYNLEKRGLVNVALYSLAGEWVATLLNETQDAGNRYFDTHLPTNIAHGAYMVKLNVDGKEVMKKLMIN